MWLIENRMTHATTGSLARADYTGPLHRPRRAFDASRVATPSHILKRYRWIYVGQIDLLPHQAHIYLLRTRGMMPVFAFGDRVCIAFGPAKADGYKLGGRSQSPLPLPVPSRPLRKLKTPWQNTNVCREARIFTSR